jgi:hypothetical protein
MPRTIPEVLRIARGGPFQKPVRPFRPQFRPPDHPSAVELRKKYKLLSVAGNGGDFERARRLKSWVRSRWNHGWDNEGQRDALDILERARRGGSFHCGGYSRVLVQCCLAVGLPARQVAIHRHRCDFRDGIQFNAGHAVAEVYCRDFAKWVILDADANAYYLVDDVPASCLDIHGLWHAKRGMGAQQVVDDPPLVIPTTCPHVSDDYLRRMFREFACHLTKDYYYYVEAHISNGYTDYPSGADRRTVWHVGVVPPPLALGSEGLNVDGIVFVEDERQFNWPLNQTFVQATMCGQKPTSRVDVRLDHNMPFFGHFELCIGSEGFRRLRGDRKVLTLSGARTRIRARCMDIFGAPGHEAELVIELKHASARVLQMRRSKYWS